MDVKFYEDKSGQWRWSARAGNNRIVADSGEGYDSRQSAEHGLRVASRVLAKWVIEADGTPAGGIRVLKVEEDSPSHLLENIETRDEPLPGRKLSQEEIEAQLADPPTAIPDHVVERERERLKREEQFIRDRDERRDRGMTIHHGVDVDITSEREKH